MTDIEIIAEIANAHQGSLELALELAPLAVSVGKADAIKFQIYFGEELSTPDHPRYQHFVDQAFSVEEWMTLLSASQKLGVPVYADVFGVRALEVAIEHNLPGVKLHSSDLTNAQIFDRLTDYDGRIFLSVGGSNLFEIQYALDKVQKTAWSNEITLMHGFQAYPTAMEDSKLSRIGELKALFGDRAKLGYMDHIDADSDYAYSLPLLAIPYGASVIEKHITLDRSAKGVDYFSSLEPEEFSKFVDIVRHHEAAVGSEPLEFTVAETKYRESVKKSWVAATEIRAGMTLSDVNLRMKRAPTNSPSPEITELIGRTAKEDIKLNQVIEKNALENKVLAVIVARSKSSRMPGKAFAKIVNETTTEHLIKRVIRARDAGFIDTIAFCTTTDESDDRLAQLAKTLPVEVYRGPVEDVLGRMMIAIARHPDHETVLRITGDDIMIDLEYISRSIEHHLRNNADYTDAKKLPGGTEVEAFNVRTLRRIYDLAHDNDGTEYLTNYITQNASQFNVTSIDVNDEHRLSCRLTIDNPEDYELVRSMIEYFEKNGKQYTYTLDDIASFVENNPVLIDSNKHLSSAGRAIDVNTGFDWARLTREPLVTVYITNFNYENYVSQAIDSVLDQSLQKRELIIIDDGSTDGSREVIERYRDRLGVKIIYQENLGLNRSNNVAVAAARGKYIVRLDADDYFHRNALEIMAKKLESNPDTALVFPDFFYVDESGEIIGQEVRHKFENVTLLDHPAHGACTMFRLEALRSVGGYSKEFNRQDGYDLWLKMIDEFKVGNINLPLFYYRQHKSNLTSDKRALLDTRAQITRARARSTATRDLELQSWIVIPVRKENSSKKLALSSIGGQTLITRSVKQAIGIENNSRVLVTTDDQDVIEHLTEKFGGEGVVLDKRPESLCAPNSPINKTLLYLLEKYENDLGLPRIICVCNYEYPLRNHRYIDQMIDSIQVFDADSSIGVTEKNMNLYNNFGNGLVPLVQNRNLRLERDFVYEDCGGLRAVSADFLKETGQILGDKSSAVLLDFLSCFKINSVSDLELGAALKVALDASEAQKHQ